MDRIFEAIEEWMRNLLLSIKVNRYKKTVFINLKLIIVKKHLLPL